MLHLPDAHSAIAVSIAVVSIFGAMVAAQAALTAQRASEAERQHVQALMLQQRRRLELQGRANYDQQLAAYYAAHDDQAEHLQDEANQVRDMAAKQAPRRQQALDRAALLDLRAQEERALRRSRAQFFRLGTPSRSTSGPTYSMQTILDRALETDDALREIKADLDETGKLFKEAHAKTVLLEALVAILVFSLFFFTLALANIGGQERRSIVTGLGRGFAAAGLTGWILIETGWLVLVVLRFWNAAGT